MSKSYIPVGLRKQVAEDARYFIWDDSGTEIIGLTAVGRATILALNMNSPAMLTARSLWVQAGWHPPKD